LIIIKNLNPNTMNYKKYFLISLIAALGLSALVGIYIFLFGDAEETEMRILTTTLAIGVFSLLGLSCATLQNREGLRWLSITGVIIPIIAFIITVYGIWSDSEIKDLWKAAGIATTLAVGLAHVSLLLLIRIKSSKTKYVLAATILFIIIVSVMFINGILCDFEQGEFYFRLLGVFAILDVLGTITTPLLNKLIEKK